MTDMCDNPINPCCRMSEAMAWSCSGVVRILTPTLTEMHRYERIWLFYEYKALRQLYTNPSKIVTRLIVIETENPANQYE